MGEEGDSRELARAGRAAAKLIYDQGPSAARISDSGEPAFAEAAIRELGRLLDAAPGLLQEQLEGSEAAAENMHVSPEQALAEIAQNADDSAARLLRFAIRDLPRGARQILAVHDGSPVRLIDAVGMSRAWISAKTDDPRATGKFGIGLKTIAGLADRFDVHSAPYHFSVSMQRPRWVKPEAAIPGFFDPSARHTLLVLHLKADYDASRAVRWLDEWGPAPLVFLRHLRCAEFVDLSNAAVISKQELILVSTRDVSVEIGEVSTTVTVDQLSAGPGTAAPRTWTRYTAEIATPPNVRRARKRTAETTPIGVAFADDGAAGSLYAGLPLGESCSLPFSLAAEFNPDTARAHVKADAWNAFLVDRLAELVIQVAILRFAEDPASAWRAVPLESEGAGDHPQTREFFSALGARVREGVDTEARLGRGEHEATLSELVFEAPELGELLSGGELREIAGGVPLDHAARDPEGRWRTVLADLGRGTEITPLRALEILDPSKELAGREPKWFAKLAEVALASPGFPYAAKAALLKRPSVPVADGRRIAPGPFLASGGALVRDLPPRTLAAALGLARQVDHAFFASTESLPHARGWLVDDLHVAETPTPSHTLRALARRPTERPLELSDMQLGALRDALSRVSPAHREELAPELGRRVLVRGRKTGRSGRLEHVLVRPSEAYLPSRIEAQREGFAQAGRGVPGLCWIEAGYAELLSLPAGERRRLTARALFMALGAQAGPRLEPVEGTDWLRNERAEPLHHPLPAAQVDAKEVLDAKRRGYWVDHLQGDWVSPDLDAVLAYLDHRGLKAAERRTRARSLILALARGWDGVYADHATARGVHRYHVWNDLGPMPATWLARLQSVRWLTNERGQRRAPRELALRSDAFLAAIGDDRSRFCREISGDELPADVAAALAFEAKPRASTLVDALASLREQHRAGRLKLDEPLGRQLRLCYLGLSAYSRDGARRDALTRRTIASESVDDLSAAVLRARFSDQGKGGLILASTGEWLAPRSVFRGRPIFGPLRPFAPAGPDALWDLLDIRVPSLADSVAVLVELAETEPDSSSTGILIDVYRHLDIELADLRRVPRDIRFLPLWVGNEWLTDRPVYAVPGQPALAARMAEVIPVWQPPGSMRPDALPNLVAATQVKLLDPRGFTAGGISPGAFSAGGRLRRHWRAAVREFAALLATVEPAAHRALAYGWDELEEAPLAHATGLEVVADVAGTTVSVPVRVFATADPLLIAYASADDLGAFDPGGRALAALFPEGDTDKLALAWAEAFKRADPASVVEAIRLARNVSSSDDGIEDLASQAAMSVGRARLRGAGRKAEAPAKVPRVDPRKTTPLPPPARRLKTLEELKLGQAQVRIVHAEQGTGTKLLKEVVPMRPVASISSGSGGGGGSGSGYRAFRQRDQEDLGFELLAAILESTDGRELRDLRYLKRAGADGIDGLRRYVELKAHGGDIPDSVTLTRAEVERGLEQGAKFILAVVGGLEAGQSGWRVLLIPDPVRTLDLVSASDVQLAGINRKRAVELRGSPSEGEELVG